mmetsp:Transcript_9279/g.13770  ORF Transcript_9279/g.13770 Transcript_9279/m.13770 type:complete len:82 (-) Transcript_9279:2225-2470(-)
MKCVSHSQPILLFQRANKYLYSYAMFNLSYHFTNILALPIKFENALWDLIKSHFNKKSQQKTTTTITTNTCNNLQSSLCVF